MNKLDYKKTFLLGFGFFSISLMWSVYNAFMPLILKRFIESATLIGFIMTIDNYLALFIQPAVGTISDSLNTRFGRRMPFIMIGMPLAGLLLIALANYKGLVMLIALLVLTNLSMSIFRSPVISLMPDLTPKEHRSRANSIINLMGGVGAVIAYFIGSKLWDINEKAPFYLSAVLMIASFVILFIFIKENRDSLEINIERKKLDLSIFINTRLIISIFSSIVFWFALYYGIFSRMSLKLQNRISLATLPAFIFFAALYLAFVMTKDQRNKLKDSLNEDQSKNVIYLLLAICSWFIAYQGIEAFFSLYGTEFLGVKESAAAYSFTFISLSFLIFAIPAGIVGTKLGKKKTILIGVIGLMTTFLIIAFLRNINLIRAVFVFSGFFWAMININSYPFVTDMAPKGMVGTYTGIYYLFSSIAAIVSPVLLGMLIDSVGYKYMFFYGALFLVIALMMMLSIGKGQKE